MSFEDFFGRFVSGGGGGTPVVPDSGGRGIIKRMRQQICVFWPLEGYDQYAQPQYGDAVEIACRWDDAGSLYLNEAGEKFVSGATVYPDRDIPNGSLMIKSALVNVTYPTDPRRNDKVFEVKKTAITPDLRNTQNLYTCYLD